MEFYRGNHPGYRLSRKKAPLRLRLTLLALLLLLVAQTTTCYTNLSIGESMRQSINETERDPLTGVIHGLKSQTLRPSEITTTTLTTACLLIHGFIGSTRDFHDFGPRLAEKGVTVRMMRLPGHGTTPADFAHLPDGALLDAVRAEYNALREEFEQVNVVGFSMGGTLGALLAAEAPVDKLVLVAPYFAVRHHWYFALPAETWHRLLGWAINYIPKSDRFVRVSDPTIKHEIFTYDQVPTSGIRQLMRLGEQARQPELLGRIHCPVLVLHSQKDFAACPSASGRAFSAIGSADKRFVWYEDSDHHLFWDYDQEKVKTEIEQFLLSPR